MSESTNKLTTRRNFILDSGRIATATALAGMALPYVHGAGNDAIQVVLIGCGGRGGGAADNALSVNSVPMKLVAMADVFEDKLNGAYNGLIKKHKDRMDVPPERKFIGFDGYKKAMDCLKPGDIAIFTTPLAFRWMHFAYAIEKGLNVFMEKPLTADGPTSRKMLQLAEQATAKNLKVGVGLMSRHSRALQELQKRVQDGELGEVVLMRGYRMSGPGGSAFTEPNPGRMSDLMYQIRNFHSFIWLSGGLFNDFYIHHVDHLCWMKNAWPVKAQALGGRHYRQSPRGNTYIDQNFDSYSVEYTFADGTRMIMDGRCVPGANAIYSSYLHGSKGNAIASKNGDCGFPSSIFTGQNPDRDKMIWTSKAVTGQQDPYLNEWNDLVDAIRNNTPYNEVPRGVAASVTSSMGRMAAHTAQEITYEQMLNHEITYAPGVENLTMDSKSPLLPDAKGAYPIPMPGTLRDREYMV